MSLAVPTSHNKNDILQSPTLKPLAYKNPQGVLGGFINAGVTYEGVHKRY